MRTLRFSVGLTVLLIALLPAVVGFLVGAVFFIYHLIMHGSFNIGAVFQIWLLTAMHGIVMYAIPFLLIGVVLIFFLDRGVAKIHFWLISLIVGLIIVAWAVFTVDFNGSLILIFALSFIGMLLFLNWVTVPIEQRTTARLFNRSEK